MCLNVLWSMNIYRSGLQGAFHFPELVFNPGQPVVLINDFKIRHVQFGGYDLVITHQVTKLGELSKNKKQACGDRQACKVLA